MLRGHHSKLVSYLLPLAAGYVLHSLLDVVFFDVDKVLSEIKREIIKNDDKFNEILKSNCLNFEELQKQGLSELGALSDLGDGDGDALHEIALENYDGLESPEKIEQLLKSSLKNYNPPKAFSPKNEYQVDRWDVVLDNSVYGTDVLGLGEPRIGLSGKFTAEKEELESKLEVKIKSFYRREDIYRGIDYMIDTDTNERIRALKPLYPDLQILSRDKTVSTQGSKETVHLIMPVSRVADRLKRFLEKFQKDNLQNLELILVSMSADPPASSGDVQRLVNKYNYNGKISVLEIDQPFSRGKALNAGAETLSDQKLVFFIDVDITFDEGTLDRCRANARQGHSVWFPIVWNQYNPEVVVSGNPPGRDPINNLMAINRWTGFWIHYGFGMICLYKSDFDGVGKFPEIDGWGGEDVGIYRNFITNNYEKYSDLEVIHAVDPGMIHVYHDRNCDRGSLTEEQYRMCMGATSETIGNRQQLAILYLKNQGLL